MRTKTFYLYRCLRCKKETELKRRFLSPRKKCRCGGLVYWTGERGKDQEEEKKSIRRGSLDPRQLLLFD
jgi:DNA-directed RNA polymerase subunit RPC12/RpoP